LRDWPYKRGWSRLRDLFPQETPSSLIRPIPQERPSPLIRSIPQERPSPLIRPIPQERPSPLIRSIPQETWGIGLIRGVFSLEGLAL
jgi:hypothetical protein